MADDWDDDWMEPAPTTKAKTSYVEESGGYRGGGGDRPPRDPRPGDWNCPSCSVLNFSNKTECFKCHDPKPEGLGGGTDRPPREPRPGDWNCPCGGYNYANKTECFKCHDPKPEGLGGGTDRPPREPRPGDWNCPCGGYNYANKTECFKCHDPKPEGLGGGTDRPPREPRPGDWNCPCGGYNYANKTECFKCHDPKPEGLGGGTDRPPREPRPGDWNCPCGGYNYANKTECFKCHDPKPEGLGGGTDRPPREPRPGDWTCPCGGYNYANKAECFKCKEPKPEGCEEVPVDPNAPPRESYVPAEFLEGDAIFDERNQLSGGTGINFKDYDNIPVNVSDEKGDIALGDFDSFSKMKLRPYLIENLTKCKYIKPTPIQKAAIPIFMNGRDIMACAQTGSGKTAAFLLPILHKFLSNQNTLSPAGELPATPEALIVAPTRELALQIGKEANAYAAGSVVKTKVMYGGVPVFSNKTSLKNGCNVCVATPGKLKQLIKEGHISLEKVQFFILDEADRMLDMGFMDDVTEIVNNLPAKGEKIAGMFSATFPDAIQKVAKQFLENYVFISVGVVGGACKDVEQVFELVEQKEKRGKLLDILKTTPDENYKIVVFCGTKKGADFLATILSERNISSTSIHGDRLQSQRETALREFTCGLRKVLVATAVAARGLDIPKVSMVINYDMPKEIEEYVHRIGRTGRVGHQGKAISFFDSTKDTGLAVPLVQILKGAGQRIPEWLEQMGAGGGFDSTFHGGVDSRGYENGVGGGGAVEEEAWD